MGISENFETILINWGEEYKKGVLIYFIVLLLKERPMYGFEINKLLLDISKSKIFLQECGIYKILKNLRKKACYRQNIKNRSCLS